MVVSWSMECRCIAAWTFATVMAASKNVYELTVVTENEWQRDLFGESNLEESVKVSFNGGTVLCDIYAGGTTCERGKGQLFNLNVARWPAKLCVGKPSTLVFFFSFFKLYSMFF